MPFGVRVHPRATPGTLDFDAIYRDIIKPAASDADWNVIRIDETPFVGEISHHFIERLLWADLVLADVSVQNGNVYYELGIRHGIAAGGTVLIAFEGSELPFDIRNQRTIFYQLTASGIHDARRNIAEALRAYAPEVSQNPIRRYLEVVGVLTNPIRDPAAFEAEFNGRITRAATVEQVHAVWNWAKLFRSQPLSSLMHLAQRFGELRDWAAAADTLRSAAGQYDGDYEVHRQLAFALRKVAPDCYAEAELEFKRALSLNPEDPEALGMLGGLYKRQGRYAEARSYYDRAAQLAPSSEYALINQAAIVVLELPDSPEEGVALYRSLLKKVLAREYVSDMWGLLVAAEAAFAVGDDAHAADLYRRALQLSASPVPFESAADQLDMMASVGFRREQALGHSRSLRDSLRRLQEPISVVRQEVGVGEIASSQLPVLIHLSDVHFGTRPGPSGDVPMHRFIKGEWTDTLLRNLEREFKGHRKAFDYDSQRLHLVVSGDFAYSASASEFRAAGEFLTELRKTLGISRERVHLVPGNHDVDWKAADIDLSYRFDNYIGFIDEFYGSELLRVRFPYLEWDLRLKTRRDEPNRLISLYSSDQLVMVGLNSCVYETRQDHFGFVGGRQLEMMDDWFLKNNISAFANVARVAIVHHHLHPFPEPLMRQRGASEVYQDLSTIRDAGLVEQELELRGFDLVLHGHKHHAQLRETLIRHSEPHKALSRLIVCGCGSTGVAPPELEQGDGNHYQVIELLRLPRKSNTAFAKVHWRELAYRANAKWRTTAAWTIEG